MVEYPIIWCYIGLTQSVIGSFETVQQNFKYSQTSLLDSVNDETISLTSDAENNDTEKAMIQETAALLASLSDVILSPIKSHKAESIREESDVLHGTMEVSLLYTGNRILSLYFAALGGGGDYCKKNTVQVPTDRHNPFNN